MYIRNESYVTAWLKAERDLATSGYTTSPDQSSTPSAADDIIPELDKEDMKKFRYNPNPAKLEDYQPGASQTLVLDALKKVAKSPKPCEKHSE